MPEIDGNNPEVQASTYINLVPCATIDEADPTIAHMYNAKIMESGSMTHDLGWLTLEAARQSFADQLYAVRWGSHSIYPTCIEVKFESEE